MPLKKGPGAPWARPPLSPNNPLQWFRQHHSFFSRYGRRCKTTADFNGCSNSMHWNTANAMEQVCSGWKNRLNVFVNAMDALAFVQGVRFDCWCLPDRQKQ